MNADKELISKKETVLTSIPTLKEKTKFSVGKSDKIIIIAHAVFEGIGIAGLISAAFWYTTAPMAPDGFKGPISTYTIAITTIISLFLAIPIAYFAFKKLATDIDNLYVNLSAEVTEFIHSHDEILYELLKLRSLFFSDSEFIKQLSQLVDNNNIMITNSLLHTVCQKFNELKSTHFFIKWQMPIRLVIRSKKNIDQINSFSFLEILNNQELSSNRSIRKAIINFIKKNFIGSEVTFESVLHETNQHAPNTGHLKNLIYGTSSGVACAEVMLSIGWTVISILIGIKAITPVSNLAWASFVVFSIAIGILFGTGMGFSRHKQKTNQLLHLRLKHRNKLLMKSREYIMNMITEKTIGQQKLKPNMEWISQH